MKKINTIILLLIAVVSYSQQWERNYDIVFAIGIDPKMAIVGPHSDRPDNEPSLDIEASFGFEWKNTRLMQQVKFHKEVNFFKWTYFQFDYKKEILPNLYGYAGLEMSAIRKTHPDYNYTSIDNYRRVTINPLTPGANLELQYKILDGSIGFFLQSSVYQAEDELRQYKPVRFDVTVGISSYF